MKKEQKSMEMGEIKRLLRLSKEHGNYWVENNEESYLQPVFQDKNSCEAVIESINTVLGFCQKQLIQGITEYKLHSGNQDSQKLLQIKFQIQKLVNLLQTQIVSQPIVLQKTELASIERLQSMAKRFGFICSMETQKEIAKFNKDESQKMRIEMEGLKQQLEKQNREVIKSLQKAFTDAEKQKEDLRRQQEQDRVRRKQRAYNPRYADKKCFRCYEYGHLMYWCPDL